MEIQGSLWDSSQTAFGPYGETAGRGLHFVSYFLPDIVKYYNTILEFYILLTAHPCIILYTKPTWCTIFLSMFISFLYMLRATCAHHQEKKLYLCDTWYSSLCMDDCLLSTLYTILCTKLDVFTR